MNNRSAFAHTPSRPLRLLVAGLLCTVLWSSSLVGQEPGSEKPAAAQGSEQETPPAAPQPPPPRGEKSTSRQATEVFRPSEEISEDLSVPFPVDI